jgi:hypothetical protein
MRNIPRRREDARKYFWTVSLTFPNLHSHGQFQAGTAKSLVVAMNSMSAWKIPDHIDVGGRPWPLYVTFETAEISVSS